MRLLPQPRRQAMFAVYAFCREVDDIADRQGNPADGLAELTRWRQELDALYAGRPGFLMALAEPVSRFDLPRHEFLRIIDGMEMDLRGEMLAPERETLRRYCRCVAGAVGMLSVRIFGSPEATHFAEHLGEALQLTNILRDLDEDAGMGRLYLPRNMLTEAGIPAQAAPAAVLAHPALARICERLAEESEAHYRAADSALTSAAQRRRLRPGLAMMTVYRRLLARLRRRGWAAPRPRVRPGRREMLWIA
ncbi:MAG: presqualene diphosphate synthase HpnD, partial [Rhodospirillales bacterium]|nr:presqualene diphosphate synthase HpnD [Rhodospirillales bacterium]